MRQSQLLYYIGYEETRAASSPAEDYLLRVSFIQRVSSGNYVMLPLGLMLIENLENLFLSLMEPLGYQAIELPVLQPFIWWKDHPYGRFDAFKQNMLKVQSSFSGPFILMPTSEEAVSQVLAHVLPTRRMDCPLRLWMHTRLFRPAKGGKGLHRSVSFQCLEFYRLDPQEEAAKEALEEFLDLARLAFKQLELPLFKEHMRKNPVLEYNTWDLYTMFNNSERMVIGQICNLKDLFSKYAKLTFTRSDNVSFFPNMICMAFSINLMMFFLAHYIIKGNRRHWPMAISPFQVHLLALDIQNKQVETRARNLYHFLQESGLKVLWDDRVQSPGKKLMESDILRFPIRITVSLRNERNGLIGLRMPGKDEEITPIESALPRVLSACQSKVQRR